MPRSRTAVRATTRAAPYPTGSSSAWSGCRASRRRCSSGDPGDVVGVGGDALAHLLIGPLHLGVVAVDVFARLAEQLLVVGRLQVMPTRTVDRSHDVPPRRTAKSWRPYADPGYAPSRTFV